MNRWWVGLLLVGGCGGGSTPAQPGDSGTSGSGSGTPDTGGETGLPDSGDTTDTAVNPSTSGSSGEDTDQDSTGPGSRCEQGYVCDEGCCEWTVEVLDIRSVVAGTTSIDVDSTGGVHIAYLDVNGGNDQLRYAHGTEQGWTFEIVDQGQTGWHCSLQLDADGVPHVTHYAFADGDLRYSVRQPGGWTTEVIDADGAVGRKSSLRFDSAGQPHVSYHDTSEDDLKYAHREAGAWVVEVVDAPDSTGDHTSLALDADDHPHISYFRNLDQAGRSGADLRHAYHDGVAWALETVAARGVVGEFTSIALDPTGQPFISYRNAAAGALEVASSEGGVWTLEVVDDDGELGDFNTSIAMDAQGRPHVTYYDTEAGALRHAVRADGVWTVQVVDDELFSGHYSAMRIDQDGLAHISYSFREDDAVNPVGIIGLKYAVGSVPRG